MGDVPHTPFRGGGLADPLNSAGAGLGPAVGGASPLGYHWPRLAALQQPAQIGACFGAVRLHGAASAQKARLTRAVLMAP